MTGEKVTALHGELWGDDWTLLKCPVCLSTYIDQGWFVGKKEEDCVTVAPDRDDYDSPIGTRGGYVEIELQCTSGHDFRLVIANHKGVQALACVVPVDEIEEMTKLCESPMETMFWDEYAKTRPSELAGLTPQVKVGSYRVDFGIEDRKLAIEIDGFEFHSSREQMAQDRKRQRNLETKGWRICRFSGREVNQDATQCLIDAVAWASCLSSN